MTTTFPITPTKLLVISKPEDDALTECGVCGEEFPIPVSIPVLLADRGDYAGMVLCSICRATQKRLYKLAERVRQHRPDGPLTPAVCVCHFPLDRCHAHNCTPPYLSKKASARQGRLL